MGVRLEWSDVKSAGVTVHVEGEQLADGSHVGDEAALCIGLQVIEGTWDELRALVEEAARLLNAEATA